jgi:hexosaminidase
MEFCALKIKSLSLVFASIAVFLTGSFQPALAQADSQPTASSLTLMPVPSSVTVGGGSFLISGQFSVTFAGYSEPRLLRARQRFMETLARETGIPFLPDEGSSSPSFEVKTAGPSAAIPEIGEDESYHLEVTPQGIRLSAPNPLEPVINFA